MMGGYSFSYKFSHLKIYISWYLWSVSPFFPYTLHMAAMLAVCSSFRPSKIANTVCSCYGDCDTHFTPPTNCKLYLGTMQMAAQGATICIGPSYGQFSSCWPPSVTARHPTPIKGQIHLTLCSLSGRCSPCHIQI